jgi:hypothetical protein
LRQHQELDQTIRVDHARGRHDHAGKGRKGDEPSHADTERDDADEREAAVLRERPRGVDEVAQI